MDIDDERNLLRRIRRRRGDDVDDLGESEEDFLDEFERSETGDILAEKQVKETKRKRA